MGKSSEDIFFEVKEPKSNNLSWINECDARESFQKPKKFRQTQYLYIINWIVEKWYSRNYQVNKDYSTKVSSVYSTTNFLKCDYLIEEVLFSCIAKWICERISDLSFMPCNWHFDFSSI